MQNHLSAEYQSKSQKGRFLYFMGIKEQLKFI